MVPAVLLLAVSACGAEPAPPAPGTGLPDRNSAASTCPEGGAEISALNGEAAMGLRVLTLEMRNCGTETLRIDGYPDVRLLDEDGQPLEVRVEHGSAAISRIDSFEVPPAGFALGPGDRATAGVVWRNTYDDTTHPPQVGAKIDIAPLAGLPRQVFTPRLGPDGGTPSPDSPATTIDLGSTGRIGLSPWRAPEGQGDRPRP
ncbi:putative secreted protein [Saccharothrix espanaensis DSM 44229]|uniref:Putative secreted protein n=1 Tax=Saccharothrix espanaensis (strain ATCC 51144 / DSM 44229 / JCM 9112 / NBRC 15066 / NRRL 15764) TaxID=1179773 RepID=K0K8Q5_SACES|nr:putative secreted protein [Saccharothrix espanaensis DSM 44229]